MITWWMYAIFASLVWGVHFNFIAKAMTISSPITIYALPSALLVVSLPFWYKTLVSDIQSMLSSSWDMKLTVGAIMFTSVLGTVAAYKAIHASNATIASLIEITYPLFVALFAMILFRENHLTWPVGVGGLLIMAGTSVIIYFHG